MIFGNFLEYPNSLTILRFHRFDNLRALWNTLKLRSRLFIDRFLRLERRLELITLLTLRFRTMRVQVQIAEIFDHMNLLSHYSWFGLSFGLLCRFLLLVWLLRFELFHISGHP